MKNALLTFSFLLIFLAIGCSTPKKTTIQKKQNSEDTIIHYHVKTKFTDGNKYNTLVENQFRELEDLELPLVKIHFNKKYSTKFDCEIDIVFEELTVTDKEYHKNKHFSKVVQEQQTQAANDNGSPIYSETIRGYVYQRFKERTLNWSIAMTTNSNANNCTMANSSFDESFVSKSVNNTLSGDERAISKKYKEPIGQSLLSEREMAKNVISRVYTKIVKHLEKSH